MKFGAPSVVRAARASSVTTLGIRPSQRAARNNDLLLGKAPSTHTGTRGCCTWRAWGGEVGRLDAVVAPLEGKRLSTHQERERMRSPSNTASARKIPSQPCSSARGADSAVSAASKKGVTTPQRMDPDDSSMVGQVT